MVTAQDVESWIGHRTVDFHYGHIALMDVKDKARELSSAVPDYLRYMEQTTAGTPAFTIIDRGARQLFNEIGPAMQLRRLQFMVRSSHLHAVKFAETLYFTREATLQSYGPEGDDYFVYVRFY